MGRPKRLFPAKPGNGFSMVLKQSGTGDVNGDIDGDIDGDIAGNIDGDIDGSLAENVFRFS